MRCKCVQCGKIFTLSDSEIEFFKSRNLSIPKRCKQCREANKNGFQVRTNNKGKAEYDSYNVSTPLPFKAKAIWFLLLITTIYTTFSNTTDIFKYICFGAFAFVTLIGIAYALANKTFIQEFDTSIYKYTFYDTVAMVEHYAKHRKETESETMEDYLYKANMLIVNKGSLSKSSKDNDTLYYNKRTNEFAVVAKAGYIRTYFMANEKYYNKQ